MANMEDNFEDAVDGDDDFELEIDADEDDALIIDDEFDFDHQSVDIREILKAGHNPKPSEPMTHPRIQSLKGSKTFREPRRGPQGHGGVGRVSGLIQNGDIKSEQDDDEDILDCAAESSPPVDEMSLSLDEVIRKRQIPATPEPFKKPLIPRQNLNNQENLKFEGDVRVRLNDKNLLRHRHMNGGTGSLKRGFSAAATSMRSSSTSLTKNVKYTPLSGIRLLANLGVVIVLEVSELPSELEDEPYFRKRRWRACYYDGRVGKSLQGVAEAPRKALAKEAAALDFLEKLKEQRIDLSPTLKVYEIPFGCRIPPSVLGALEGLVASLGLGEVNYKQDLVQVKGKDKYQYTITVAENQWSEASYEIKHARYCAAKRAYDDLMCGNGEYRLDNYFSGDKCMDDSKHELIEAEEIHVCQADLPHNPKRKLETLYGSGTVRPKRVKTVVEPVVPKVVSNLREQHEASRGGSFRDSVCGSVASSIISIL